MQPYPEYKDSGVPWLGKIPAHWELPRLGSVLKERGEKNDDGSVTDVLSVLKGRGVIPYEEKGNIGNKKSEDITRYKIVKPNDIVVNCMNVIIGSVGLSKYTGCLSPVYYVLVNRSENHDPGYLNAYFQSVPFQRSLVRIGKGILEHRMRIPMELLKCEPFPIPPVEEQTQIVKFLDWKTAQIDKFIRNKRRLIALLREQKQSIINQAVTRGLDPNVTLKPSGVEWLGDIPAHWETAPLKRLANINSRVLPESTDKDYTFRYIDIGSVGTGHIMAEPEIVSFGEAPSRARRILQKGDSILSTVRTYLKAVYHVSSEVEDWIASTGFAVLTPKEELYSPFLGLMIQNDDFINQVIRESIGVVYPAITDSKIGVLPLAYPKSFSEQQKILEYVASRSEGISQSITRAEREIALIREYQTRLIADVVTGQVDVRGIEVPAADGGAEGVMDMAAEIRDNN